MHREAKPICDVSVTPAGRGRHHRSPDEALMNPYVVTSQLLHWLACLDTTYEANMMLS